MNNLALVYVLLLLAVPVLLISAVLCRAAARRTPSWTEERRFDDYLADDLRVKLNPRVLVIHKKLVAPKNMVKEMTYSLHEENDEAILVWMRKQENHK